MESAGAVTMLKEGYESRSSQPLILGLLISNSTSVFVLGFVLLFQSRLQN